jgi:hypothetical protein
MAAALVTSPVFAAAAAEQTFFYSEVAKDGRIYVYWLLSSQSPFLSAC